MNPSTSLAEEMRGVLTRRITTLLAAAVLQFGSVAAQAGLAAANVAEINAKIDTGTRSAEQLVRRALMRIKAYEPKLHAIIRLNPHAQKQARASDKERCRNTAAFGRPHRATGADPLIGLI